MDDDRRLWVRTVCRKNGIQVTDEQLALLEKYVTLLLDWNKKINLISRRDTENVWENHIAHSIAPLFKIFLPDKAAILDLGTGGGLPGIPWKILCESIAITLIDSTQKKVNAVQSMIDDLGLTNARAVWGRAEEAGRMNSFKGKFDFIVARGVGPLDELTKLAEPFLGRTTKKEEGGLSPPALLAFKGGEISDELEKTKQMKSVKSVEVFPLTFANPDATGLTDKKFVVVRF